MAGARLELVLALFSLGLIMREKVYIWVKWAPNLVLFGAAESGAPRILPFTIYNLRLDRVFVTCLVKMLQLISVAAPPPRALT